MSSLEDRFWEKVNKDKGEYNCWIWVAGQQGTGYGAIAKDPTNNDIIGAHRASWIIHNDETPSDQVLHMCDNKLCVNPDHLYVGTAQDNVNDSIERGQFPTGERHGHSKLTEDDVVEIRARYRKEDTSCAKLGDEYGVSSTAIRYIIKRKTWKNI